MDCSLHIMGEKDRNVAANRGACGDKPVRDVVDLNALYESARRASTLLKAMGNPHRLIVLCQLLKEEHNVGDLEKLVGLSQSALSQHLARLRRDGLVTTRRSAQTIYYSLAGHEAEAIISTLYRLYCSDKPLADPLTLKGPRQVSSSPPST